ncbi:ester cyclase [uncultured Jatrophihabitans sp.]|uniref:ester cyclase n=1 Tax=uncultured Jatrophihabitans sp. TaxID=1610747 RepID=UPI0035C9DB42
MSLTTSATGDVALRSLSIMAEGDLTDFEAVIARDAVNREDIIEPPGCRVGGPDGFHATALWLRSAFADLSHELHHVVVQDDLVVIDATMSGWHTGDFVTYTGDGELDRVWAPTGRSFAVRQTHWQHVVDAKVTEHWAVRDDLGQGLQLGWMPPTPPYLIRCALAKRRHRR